MNTRFRILSVIAAAGVAMSACSNDTPPAATEARDSRPNILLIVIDDLGFTDLGSYGSEIRTPNLDSLADRGLRFTSFYVSPNCAPTRSMLLSGMDNHLSGNGAMVEHLSENQRGLDGYEGYLNFRVTAMPELLSDSGYRTYMAGKWHLGATEETSPAARGFDRSYALLLGGASHFSDKMGLVGAAADAPYREDGRLVEQLPDDFYSTTFYTDKIIEYIEGDRSESDAPFFAYLSYTAVHWPLQVPDAAMDLYAGDYDAGYDELRARRFEKAVAAGVVPSATRPNPGAANVAAWDDLSEEEQRTQARKMEIYAAMLELVDDNVGRLFEYLESVGELEDTLVIVMSDNGAEGNRRFRIGGDNWVETTFDHSYERMGQVGSYVFVGPGWAQASSAPFRLWKAHTAEGGIRAPLIAAGPGVTHRGSVTDAVTTVRDIMPTILEATETEFPGNQYAGRSVLPMSGRSQRELLAGASDSVHPPDEYFGWEIFGGRAVRQGDWKLLWVAGPNGDDRWMLFNLSEDPGETNDLASALPEKLAEMTAVWETYVSENNVTLPTDHLQAWGDQD